MSIHILMWVTVNARHDKRKVLQVKRNQASLKENITLYFEGEIFLGDKKCWRDAANTIGICVLNMEDAKRGSIT